MTERAKRFCDEFIASGQAAEAARRAGYSERSARSTAARLLANDDVKQTIGRRLESLEAERIASADEIMAFLSAVVRGQVKDQFGLDASLADRIKAAQELLKRFSVSDRHDATLVRLDQLFVEFKTAIGTNDDATHHNTEGNT